MQPQIRDRPYLFLCRCPTNVSCCPRTFSLRRRLGAGEGRTAISPLFSVDFQTNGFLCRSALRRTLALRMGEQRTFGRRLQRRGAVRYKLRLPVIFHWNDGVDHTSGGFTSDVALDGALILSAECPPVGSEIRVEVLLPSPELENEELRIGCSGKVIHASERSGYSAFGFCGMFQDEQITRHVVHFETAS